MQLVDKIIDKAIAGLCYIPGMKRLFLKILVKRFNHPKFNVEQSNDKL